MHNIGLIIRRDVASLFRNAICVIVTIGLIAFPTIFAGYNILACWDVFNNTGRLTVAVANDDEGFTSDLVPINVNVGDRVVSALGTNEDINWVFTNSEDAIEGTKSGEYYAALVIPEDFSREMLTFYEGDADPAEIIYYVNEKKNAISPNITNVVADTVSYEVNAVFVETISEVTAGLAKGLSQNSDEFDIEGRVAILTGHIRSLADEIDQAADVLGLYSSLVTDSQTLLDSSANLLETTRKQVSSAVDNAKKYRDEIRSTAQNLKASVDSLSGLLGDVEGTLSDIDGLADSLLNAASADASDIAAELRGKADEVDGQASQLYGLLSTLEALRSILESADPALDGAVVNSLIILVDDAIAEVSQAIGLLEQTSSDLRAAADDIESGVADAQDRVAALREAAASARSNIDALRSDFETNLKPTLDRLGSDLDALASDLDGMVASLDSLGSDLASSASSAADALGTASSRIDTACKDLHASAQELRQLADDIDAALATGDMETLRSLLEGDVGDIASALSAPVQIQREAVFPVDGFGSAMAPLYNALALFIGALLIMVAMKPEVSERRREGLENLKPREAYFGRFGAVALVSLMQTTLLALFNLLFLKVQVNEPLLFLLCFWISGLVFAFIVYTLVAVFGNLGKGIAVLLLIVQVTGCGGSYPLPILPDFVQAVSPWLPATHVVDAMRAAMFGVYQNDFWISMGKLALYVLPFLFIGLALRKPLVRLMHNYLKKVDKCGLME